MRHQVTKRHCQVLHAKRRALERYGLDINRFGFREIIQKIQTGKAQLLYKESHRLSAWVVEFQGKEYPVVYDKLRGSIVTFLPPDQTLETRPKFIHDAEFREKMSGLQQDAASFGD